MNATQPSDMKLEDLAPERQTQVVAKAFQALAEPVRLRIIELLLEHGELTVGELTGALPVSQPRVSVHLACLSDCGFTAVHRVGRRSYYRVAGPGVVGCVAAVRDHADSACAGIVHCLECAPTSRSACC